jgi:hypothetical protein
MPLDVAGGLPGRGEGSPVFDCDLADARLNGDLGGLASVRQADLDPLTADHDRATGRYPPPDQLGLW